MFVWIESDILSIMTKFLPFSISLAATTSIDDPALTLTRLGLQEWFKLAARHGYTAAAMVSQDFKNSSSLQLEMDIHQLLWFSRITIVQACRLTWIYSSCYGFLGLQEWFKRSARHGYTAAAMVFQDYNSSSLPLNLDIQQLLWFPRISRMVQACSQTWIYSSCYGFIGLQEWFKLPLDIDIQQLLWFPGITMVQACRQTWIYSSRYGFLGLRWFKLAARHGYIAAAMVSQDFKNDSSLQLDMDIHQLLWFLGLQQFKLAVRHGYTAAAMVSQVYNSSSLPLDMDIQQPLWLSRITMVQACSQTWLYSSRYGFLGLRWFKLPLVMATEQLLWFPEITMVKAAARHEYKAAIRQGYSSFQTSTFRSYKTKIKIRYYRQVYTATPPPPRKKQPPAFTCSSSW